MPDLVNGICQKSVETNMVFHVRDYPAEVAKGSPTRRQVAAHHSVSVSLDKNKPSLEEYQLKVQQLIEGIKENDPRVRFECAQALVQIGSEPSAAITVFTDGLKDADVAVRYLRAWALGRIGPEAKAAVPQLTDRLKEDGNAAVLEKCAWALARISGTR